MSSMNLTILIAKLNDVARSTLEAAAGFGLSQTHYTVEIEHWLLKLLEQPQAALTQILKHYDVNMARLEQDLNTAIGNFKRGNARTPALAQQILDWLRTAWNTTSLEFNQLQINTGHLLYSLLSDDYLQRLIRGVSTEFTKISLTSLKTDFADLVAQSQEANTSNSSQLNTVTSRESSPLGRFTLDLTEQAKQGKLDPVLGRENEIRQTIDILTRRRQNNPILVGEAGVGKTAIAEGLAQCIIQGHVPAELQNVSIKVLDLALLQAGAGIKGEFENRLKELISEIKTSPTPIILFIDEAHTLIGAGGQAGQGDAANLLKPALARGELRTIAATTWAEYKKYFEKDAALTRRFQVVKVDEPRMDVAIDMLRSMIAIFEKHHQVRILDEAVCAAVRLSMRYIPGRQLPDKAVSLLDTACSRVRISHVAIPPAIEDRKSEIEKIQVAIALLEREAATGVQHAAALKEFYAQKKQAEKTLEDLNKRWEQEKKCWKEIQVIRQQLLDPDKKAEPKISEKKLLQQLQEHQRLLAECQGKQPLIQLDVDAQTVATVIESWTGIPVGKMLNDEMLAVLNLQNKLAERIIGQSHALEILARSIQISRANLTDPRKPVGVFLLVGSSGIGKTETALALADLFYGGEQALTVVNMSEFKEQHKISMLTGSPPGYVGYGEGGVLTEAIRRRPYSVVLLDEIEKAHPEIQDVFYQMFDKGSLMDSEGRVIDFKNTVIIMTANVCADSLINLSNQQKLPDEDTLNDMLRPELLKNFKAAFLGRVTTIPYFPLNETVIHKIIVLQLKRLQQRVTNHYGAELTYSPQLLTQLAQSCNVVESGARDIDNVINKKLMPLLATEFLRHMGEGKKINAVQVSTTPQGEIMVKIDTQKSMLKKPNVSYECC